MKALLPLYGILILLALSCTSEPNDSDITNLAEFIEFNDDRVLDELIACAGGKDSGLFIGDEDPTSVIYLPIEGATDVRYFESETVLDSLDFAAYNEVEPEAEPLFNGKLIKFNVEDFEGEKMCIVSFKTEGRLHLSNPIRLKSNVKPTEVNDDLATVQELGVNPRFDWEVGLIDENAIYFQVIADEDGNFISGTYTFDQNFTFYDLDNVVLNITDPDSNPELQPNTNYNFTLMGVSTDNWVNLLVKKDFRTN